MNKKLKLFTSAILCGTLINGCSSPKLVDCNIEGQHTHIYVNKDQIKKMFSGEYETQRSYQWTEEYVETTDEIKHILENDLYRIDDNLDYLQNQIQSHPARRQEYVYDYVYGSYYGYGYHYFFNATTSKYEYGWGYGYTTGYHWTYRWKDIPMGTHTENPVKDITYSIQLYKIDEDGKASSKTFPSLEEASPEYNYFKLSNVLVQHVSDAYQISNHTKDKTYHL